MSFVIGEKLLEFAIRIAFDDLKNNKNLILNLLPNELIVNEGLTLIDDTNNGEITHEATVMDVFAKRLSEIPKKPSEAGKDSIFDRGVPDAEKLWEYMQECNIGIRSGFPRDQEELPCICINIGSEDEGEFIGHAGFDSSEGAHEIASTNDTSYTITILTTNYEETLIWYVIIKYALMKYRIPLEGYGLQSARVRWEDLEPGPEYIQSGTFVYQRAALFSCMKVDSFLVEPPVAYTSVEQGEVGVV